MQKSVSLKYEPASEPLHRPPDEKSGSEAGSDVRLTYLCIT